jgi:hypothetical protein
MELFPAIPLEDWRDSKETMHRFLQIVGKVRLASSRAETTGGMCRSTSPGED